MENLLRIINSLPLVIEILSMLIQMAVPVTGKQLWAFEREVHKLTAKIGDQFVLRALSKAHKDEKFVNDIIRKALLDHPVPLRNKGWRTVSVLLIGGTKAILRTPYLREDHSKKRGPKRKKRGKGRRGLYPVLEALGIQNGVSPASQSEIALYTIQAASYEEAVQLLKRRGLDLDVSTLSRLAIITAENDIALRNAALARARQIPIPENGPLANKRVRVSLDGGRVRTRKNKKGPKPKKGGRRFDAPWREPRILVIDILDDNGKSMKFSLPLYDVLIADADAIFNLTIGYLRLLGASGAAQLIFIADGADWIWNRIDRLRTEAEIPESVLVEAIDFYHACEHLSKAVDICPKMSKKQRIKLFEELRHILRHQEEGAKIIMRKLWEIHSHKKMSEALTYFITHSTRMKYAQLKKSKLPIGSGQVESAVRRVINLRFKSPGSFWKEETVENLMHLRAEYKAGRWDELMERLLDQEFHIPVFGSPNESEVVKMDYTRQRLVDFKMAA